MCICMFAHKYTCSLEVLRMFNFPLSLSSVRVCTFWLTSHEALHQSHATQCMYMEHRVKEVSQLLKFIPVLDCSLCQEQYI